MRIEKLKRRFEFLDKEFFKQFMISSVFVCLGALVIYAKQNRGHFNFSEYLTFAPIGVSALFIFAFITCTFLSSGEKQ